MSVLTPKTPEEWCAAWSFWSLVAWASDIEQAPARFEVLPRGAVERGYERRRCEAASGEIEVGGGP